MRIKIKVQESSEFQRVENDVITDLELTMSESVLGAKKVVQTLWGNKEIDIPRNTIHNSKHILLRQGFLNDIEGVKGDQVISIKVKLPKELTAEQEALFKKLKTFN